MSDDERSGDESTLSSSEPPAPAEQLRIAKEYKTDTNGNFAISSEIFKICRT